MEITNDILQRTRKANVPQIRQLFLMSLGTFHILNSKLNPVVLYFAANTNELKQDFRKKYLKVTTLSQKFNSLEACIN